MNDKFRALLNDTAIFAVGSLGSKFILFLLVPLYTNVMPANQYGTADLVITIGQLLMPFVSLVVFDALLRFGLSKYERREDVLLASLVVVIFGVVAAIAIMPLFDMYQAVADYRWYLCGYVLTYMVSNVELAYLKASNKNRLYAGLSILQTFLVAFFNILLLVVLRMGIEGYLLSNIIALGVIDILVFIVGNFTLDLRRAKLDWSLLKRMLVYSAPLVLNNVSWWVIHSVDKVMVEWALGAGALGLFTVASKVPSLINTAVTIFQQAWGISTIKEIETSNDPKYYSDVFDTYSMLCVGACIALVAIIKPFMSVYVGEQYFDAWRYVPLLLVASAMSGVASFFGSMYGALKKSVNSMLSTLVAAIINAGLCLMLLSHYGIWAAVIATFVSYAVLAFTRMYDVLRFVKFNIKLRKYLLCLVIATVQAVIVSADFHIYVISAICAGMFALVNRDRIVKAIRIGQK